MSDRLRRDLEASLAITPASNVHHLPLPVGLAALRVLDAARRPASGNVDRDLIEAIGRSVIEQDAFAELLLAANTSGRALPLHIMEAGRFNALKAAGLFSALLSRNMNDARNQRSGGSSPQPHPSLPGADDLVTYTSAPTISDPCAGPTPHPSGITAGASAQPRVVSTRIRNADAPEPSGEWPTCG
jgi:hypothetical protein